MLGLLVVVIAVPLVAQDGTRHMGEIRQTPWGQVLDFRPDGAWRGEAARVRTLRQALLSRGDFAALNSPAGLAPAAVTGTKRVPAILFSFADSMRGTAYDTAQYRQILFGDPAPSDRPYSMRTYYAEISNGLLTMLGQVVGWIALDNNESFYTGPFGGCSNPYGTTQCNGVWSGPAFAALQNGLREALSKAGATGLDWGQFDNDGPDGVPNSGDDDGVVDMTLFVHSERDGACATNTNNHIWAHRANLSFATSTPRAGGGFIQVSDYTVQSGVGGQTACDVGQVMAIGTAAHETGHAFDLPDLYSFTIGEGIGHWGLMASGNYRTPPSPAYMSAWARAELGWITQVLVAADTTIVLSPVETADTALILPVPGSSEYFLLENRQPLGSDAQLHGPGLLIWHVDSALIAQRRNANSVQDFLPYGIALEQADGANHLQAGTNRGDAGDPFPGSSNKRRWSYNTTPSSARNNGAQTWITVDSISQVSAAGPVRFRIEFGTPSFISVSATGPSFRLDGVSQTGFVGVLTPGSMHTLDMDSVQTIGGSRWIWQSWSNGMARSHTFTTSAGGDTISATVGTEHRITVTVTGPGIVAASTGADLTGGVFYPQGTAITLTPVPVAGNVFESWAFGGATDTTAIRNVTLTTPTTLAATFNPVLVSADATLTPVMGAAFSQALTATGGAGAYIWTQLSGNTPPGLVMNLAGQVSGTPTATGSTTLTARVTSGRQVQTRTITFNVSVPQLATADVVGYLLGSGAALSADALNYLDLLGNKNSSFDLGDFLAWVQATGATPTADQMAAVFARTGGDR